MKTKEERELDNFNSIVREKCKHLSSTSQYFKTLYENKDNLDLAIKNTMDINLFFSDFKSFFKDVNIKNINEYLTTDKVLELHSITVLQSIEYEINDFLENNRFLNQTILLKDNIKGTNSRNLILDVISEQSAQLVNLYNKSLFKIEQIKEGIDYLRSKNDTESNIVEGKIEKIKEDISFIKIKNSIFSLPMLKKYKSDKLIEYNKLINQQSILTNKIISLNTKSEFLSKNIIKKNYFLDKYKSFSDVELKSEIKLNLLKDEKFKEKLNSYENEKTFAKDLEFYNHDLSLIFNEAIGDKADFILQNLNKQIREFKLDLFNYDDTALTKLSKKLVNISPQLRLKGIEGKTFDQYIKESAIKFGVKKTLVWTLGVSGLFFAKSIFIVDPILKFSTENHIAVEKVIKNIQNKNIISQENIQNKNLVEIDTMVDNLDLTSLKRSLPLQA